MSVCVGTQPLPAKPLGRSDSLGSRARFVWRSAGEVRVAQKWLHSSRGSEKTGGLLEAGSPRHRLTGGLWPCAGVPGPLLGHKGGRVPGEGVLPTEEGAGGEAGTRSRVVAGAGVRRGPAELEGSWVFPPRFSLPRPQTGGGVFPGAQEARGREAPRLGLAEERSGGRGLSREAGLEPGGSRASSWAGGEAGEARGGAGHRALRPRSHSRVLGLGERPRAARRPALGARAAPAGAGPAVANSFICHLNTLSYRPPHRPGDLQTRLAGSEDRSSPCAFWFLPGNVEI